MKIITATAAKNIATDFANNGMGEIIDGIMDNIFYQAMHGERTLEVTIPVGKMSRDLLKSLMIFFNGLEYETSGGYSHNGNWCFGLKW